MKTTIFDEQVKTLADFPNFDYIPLNNQVVLYVPPMSNKTKGGIIIPDASMKSAAEVYFTSTKYHLVVAVSQRAKEQFNINEGDYISFNKMNVQGVAFFTTPNYKDDNFIQFNAVDVEGKLAPNGIKKVEEIAENQSVKSSSN